MANLDLSPGVYVVVKYGDYCGYCLAKYAGPARVGLPLVRCNPFRRHSATWSPREMVAEFVRVATSADRVLFGCQDRGHLTLAVAS